jgi:hypothetical protein
VLDVSCIGRAKLENVSSLWKFMHSCCENISGRANFCFACEETEGVIAANGRFLMAAVVVVGRGQRDRVPRPLAQDPR